MKALPIALLAAALAACSDSNERATGVSATSAPSGVSGLVGEVGLPQAQLGGPIPGLTAAERAAFDRGRVLFNKRFKPSEGLGPLYNATACASCHSHPVPGGSAPLYRNFFVAAEDFGVLQLPLAGLPSIIVPSFGDPPHLGATFTLEGRRTDIPATVSGGTIVAAQRNTIPIFGTGLFEFISDATIQSNADPDDAIVVDGVSGRFNVDVGASSMPIGRFGVKSQANNVEFFTRGPLQNQMGITSNPFLGSGGVASLCAILRPQAGSGADQPFLDDDAASDPEISRQDLGDLIAFTRFLAPPMAQPFDAAAQAGEDLFQSLGCVKCHIPVLPSSRGPVRAYTDLLLHDMGSTLADGIHQGAPQASMISSNMTTDEFRTQPLWGVSLHGPWLHDGRAETLQEAIELHGGEAQAIRDSFDALSQADKDDIIAFLEHL